MSRLRLLGTADSSGEDQGVVEVLPRTSECEKSQVQGPERSGRVFESTCSTSCPTVQGRELLRVSSARSPEGASTRGQVPASQAASEGGTLPAMLGPSADPRTQSLPSPPPRNLCGVTAEGLGGPCEHNGEAEVQQFGHCTPPLRLLEAEPGGPQLPLGRSTWGLGG